MFDIGLAEVFVVLVVALFAIGPDRLPEAARALGRVIRKMRKVLGELRSALDEALAEDERKQAPAASQPAEPKAKKAPKKDKKP
ncbi:MAG: twin-arginine translocase subunit TatB [Proteobacteria bacterium]|nr:twin-arginine translocase subunit TatB [Pseudomonadota bacterium]